MTTSHERALRAEVFSDVRTLQNGAKSWIHKEGDKYIVTGEDVHGKKFSQTHSNWFYARGINLWRGRKWLQRGKYRMLLEETYN